MNKTSDQNIRVACDDIMTGMALKNFFFFHYVCYIEINRCPKGYKALDDSCYKFVNSPLPFDEARKTCNGENADVMTIDTNIKQGITTNE